MGSNEKSNVRSSVMIDDIVLTGVLPVNTSVLRAVRLFGPMAVI
jgi:hypothetical protein